MEQEKTKNNTWLIILLILIILGLVGYIVYDKVLSNKEETETEAIIGNNETKIIDKNKITTIADFPIEADREGENNVLLNSSLENIYSRLEDTIVTFNDKGDEFSFEYNNVKYLAICDENNTNSPGCKKMTLKINDNTVYSDKDENPLLIVTTDNIIVRATNIDNSLGNIYLLDNNGTLKKKVDNVVGWYKEGLLNGDTDVVIKNNILYYLKLKNDSTLTLNYILLYDNELEERNIEEFESTIN